MMLIDKGGFAFASKDLANYTPMSNIMNLCSVAISM